MKILARLTMSLSLLAAAQVVIADGSTDRQPAALRGITSVAVKVTDKSKIPGMPSEAMVQSQLENLLQTKCGLGITSRTSTPGPEIHVDLLMFPVVLGQPKVTTNLALVRTSVWRPVLPAAADGRTPDTSTPPLQMTGWILTTITDPKMDPLLATTILNHASTLESTLRAAGQMHVLPRNFSEAFFASRLPEMKTKIEALVNQKIKAVPSVKTSHVEIFMELANGVLTYRFGGKIEYTLETILPVTKEVPVDSANPAVKLDLAALSAIGALSDAKICFNLPSEIPGAAQCVAISDLFQ
jgi:hypothetical protein